MEDCREYQRQNEAKKGILNVIIGLIVIMIAATLVTLLFSKPHNSTPCSKYDGQYDTNLGAICIGTKLCADGLQKEYREYTGAEGSCSLRQARFRPRAKSLSRIVLPVRFALMEPASNPVFL